jgi:predicted dehydrogenase
LTQRGDAPANRGSRLRAKKRQVAPSPTCRAIRGGESHPVPLEDVLHGMEVFDALVSSAKAGDIVAVSSI